MLERLYVDNYRCFVNFEGRFGSRQLILGPNGGGKTTLFHVLATLRDFCVNGVPAENLFFESTRTRWQTVPAQTFELDVAGNDGVYTFRLVVEFEERPPRRPRIAKEEVLFSGKPILRFAKEEVQLFNDRHEETVKYPFEPSRSALATLGMERPEHSKLFWFNRWLGGLLYICPDPHLMSSSLAEREAFAPTVDMSNFAAWYRHLRLEGPDQPLLDDLRTAMPGFERMDLKGIGANNYVLQFSFSVNTDNGPTKRVAYPQYLNELSDGQRVLVGLYTVLHFALRPGMTVLFDEPDNYIALREIQPWLEKLFERVEEQNAQVLIASHHPELLNRLAMQEGLVLDRPAGRHTRARAFTDPALTGLSPAELVTRGWEND